MSSDDRITLSPYLTFEGNCREAMAFYKDAIGGELEFHTFESMPEEVPADVKDRIMHASLRGGGVELMASDSMPGHSPEIVNGNSVALSVATHAVLDARGMFERLADGGKVTMPFEPAFWGGDFGMLTDRFGMHWMVSSVEQSEKVADESVSASA